MRIPYLSTPDVPIVESSLHHLPIAEITDDLVLFKDGGAALVLESTSLNFSLLSEREQEATVVAYAAILNSLSFSIQIVIRTQRKDISSYMSFLDEAGAKIANPLLSGLMASYKRFIIDSVKKKNVLGKNFYFVIPFSPLELGVAKSFASVFKAKGPLPFPRSYVLKKAKTILFPRRDHLIRQAGRLGVRLTQLTNVQLVELYYNFYNPAVPSIKKIAQEVKT